MYIEIDPELESKIVAESLLESLEMTYEEILSLGVGELEDFQEQDLEYNIRLLDALKIVYRHYAIFEDWNKTDEYTLTVANEDGDYVLSPSDEALATEAEQVTEELSLIEFILGTKASAVKNCKSKYTIPNIVEAPTHLNTLSIDVDERNKSTKLPNLEIDENNI